MCNVTWTGAEASASEGKVVVTHTISNASVSVVITKDYTINEKATCIITEAALSTALDNDEFITDNFLDFATEFHEVIYAYEPSVKLNLNLTMADQNWNLPKYIPYLDKLQVDETAAAAAKQKERESGDYLLKLMERKKFDLKQVDEFKTMINMVKHMNIMLFKETKEANMAFKLKISTLQEVADIAVEVIHYFDKLGKTLDLGIDKIREIKPCLPNIGPSQDRDDLKTALDLWYNIIFSELAPTRKCEALLFSGFADFFDAQVYHPFLMVRRENNNHSMCTLVEYLDAIFYNVEYVGLAYATITREMKKFAAAMQAARDRLMPDLEEFQKEAESERILADVKSGTGRSFAFSAAAIRLYGTTMDASAPATIQPTTEETSYLLNMNIKDMTKDEKVEHDRLFDVLVRDLHRMKRDKEAAMAATKAKAAGRFIPKGPHKGQGKGRGKGKGKANGENEGNAVVGSSALGAAKGKKENVRPKRSSSI